MKLTAVILTKNEELNISDCVKTLGFCDEILVIDDNSTDKTRDLARKYRAKVTKKSLNNDFAKQRNFALTKAKNDWVLFIDADERVSKDLAKEIGEAIKSDEYCGYFLKRRDRMWGELIKHGEVGKIKLLRLAKKKAGKWTRSVHETWKIKEETSELKSSIIHHPHKDLSEFIRHIEKFSTLHAKENIKEGKTSSVSKILLMPMAHFTKNFFIKLGFLDGIGGFIIALLMSFHSFLAWSKMYMLQKND